MSAARSLCRQCLRRRWMSTSAISRASEAPAAAQASSSAAPSLSNPKIAGIVDQISSLSLLEAADLVTALKSRLNIADISYAAPAAAAPAPAAGADAADAAPAAEEKPKEKTLFTVNLKSIDASQKAKAIKEVKAVMPNMNLVEAKKFVESLPKVLKENVTKEDAEKLKKAFEAIGGSVALD